MKNSIFPMLQRAVVLSILTVGFHTPSIYAREMADIAASILQAGAQWKARENSISRLPSESRRMLLGAMPETAGPLEEEPLTAAPTAPLPQQFDWRNYDGGDYVTDIRNQQTCGSCWAFATTAALESQYLISQNLPGGEMDLSEQILISCSGAGSCEGGYVSYASDYLTNPGTSEEACYPYTATNGNCNDACELWTDSAYHFADWGYTNSGEYATVSEIKNGIYSYGPLVAVMEVYSDFYYYDSGVYSQVEGTHEGGHAILVIGWDDSQEAFICKNSWGTGWGENGYFRIAYSQLNSPVDFGFWTYHYLGASGPQSAEDTVDVSVASGDFDGDAAKEFVLAERLTDGSLRITWRDDSAHSGVQLAQATTGVVREMSLAAGNFDSDDLDEVVLACVQADGTLAAITFDSDGTRLNQGVGGACSQVSVASGQFDTDPYDEYVVSLLQSNGTLAAISYNHDGTRIGKGVGGICSIPRVATGNFDSNAADDEYVISLLQADGTLAAITYQGNGTRIGKGVGGLCTEVTVSAGNFRSNNDPQEEYVVSLLQSDGTLAAITYYANGTRIGKGVGGVCSGPQVASGHFAGTDPLDGYGISLIQTDGTPAAIFYTGEGILLEQGVIAEAAQRTAFCTGDVDADGSDEGILAHVPGSSQAEWTVFEEDGVAIMAGP